MAEVKAESVVDPSRMGGREFVALMAALMASNAIAIDAMVPALPAISSSLSTSSGEGQLVIAIYLMCFGASQIVYGPLSDSFGRKKILVSSLVFYAMFSAIAGLAWNFEMLLGARALQGIAAGATRVLVVSVIRDCVQGAAMARIMSTALMVFMIVPVLAPSFGQAILFFASWRYIFILFCVYGVGLAIWTMARLAETLPEAHRRPFSFAGVRWAVWATVSDRQSMGNTVVQMLQKGCVFAFITSIQQIVFEVFHRPKLIGLVFACVAGSMALGSFVNSRLVVALGPRRMQSIGLCLFTMIGAFHALLAYSYGESLLLFVMLQAANMSLVGLIGANSSALAMEPVGHVAGTASSVQGAITTVGGSIIGLVIGQQFNGTTVPFLFGLACAGFVALAVGIWGNRPSSSERPT